MTPHLLSATSIEGTNVVNNNDETIGEIKDLMIDWRTGEVAYAVLSFGGFMGFGDKLFAFPLDAFDFENRIPGEKARLNVPKEKLVNTPGFDKENWPQHYDQSFTEKVRT